MPIIFRVKPLLPAAHTHGTLPRAIAILCLLACIAVSCSESKDSINPSAFNRRIASRTDILSPQALILLFDQVPEGESAPPEITVQQQGNTYVITLIRTGLQDDSVAGEKTVMEATQEGDHWRVHHIWQSWKCHEGRGSWGWVNIPCA